MRDFIYTKTISAETAATKPEITVERPKVELIAPYKGELEIWYNKNKSFWVDMMIAVLTVWVVVFPQSNLTHKVFKDLPKRMLVPAQA